MRTNWKALILVGILSSATTITGFKLFGPASEHDVIFKESSPESMVKFTSLPSGVPGDFTVAAEVTTPTVVHIRSSVVRQQQRGPSSQFDFFRDFFGDDFGGGGGGPQRSEGTGSGVVITQDGYIVTNNHVVEGASELEVTLNNKSKYKAKLIGTDPSTDIAVIKIEAKTLPAITFGNSDAIKVGEWVVAVGNPFNLESTVTAGIVSAKGRGLGIIGQSQQRRNYQNRSRGDQNEPRFSDAIESFIQTDAVVNPGNSGGALVNLKGELVGINTAIASPTGSFAGYAFAVPSSIVKKVSTDLIKFGNVQRGYLGIGLEDLDSRKAEDLGVKVNSGAYVSSFSENSAAKEAGIAKGDVIVKVDGNRIGTVPELQQSIGIHRPGDKVTVTVNRDGKERDYKVTLKNLAGNSDIVKPDESALALKTLGGSFSNLSDQEKQRLSRYKVDGGVKVTSTQGGKLARVGVEEGFVITKVNGKAVKSVKELEQSIAGKAESMVQFEGLYLDAPYEVFQFGFTL